MKTLAAIALVVLLFSTSHARALEIIGGTGNVTLLEGGSAFDVTVGGYTSLVFDFLQLGAAVNYQTKAHQTASVSSLSIFLGGTLNIGAKSEAFFISAGPLIRSASSDPEVTATTTEDGEEVSDPTGFGLHALVGKRFPIGGPLTYRPNAGIVLVGGIGFVIYPVQLSVLF